MRGSIGKIGTAEKLLKVWSKVLKVRLTLSIFGHAGDAINLYAVDNHLGIAGVVSN